MAEQMSKQGDDQQATKTTPKKSSNKLIVIIIGAAIIILIIVPAMLFWIAKSTIFNEKNTATTVSGLIEQATDGKVDIDASKGEVTVKGDNGSEFSTKQTLPSDFPKEVPLYTPYEVTGSLKTSENGKANWSVVTTTTSSYDAAKASLGSLYGSWEELGSYEANGTEIKNYSNGTYDVTVTIVQPSGADKQTTITYIAVQK